MRLKDKICIVTGAAQGIGLATALKFAREGATVIVCDRQSEAVDARWRSAGPRARPPRAAKAEGVVVDVTDRTQVDAMVKAVDERHGRIDVLVNNAGITRDARLVR